MVLQLGLMQLTSLLTLLRSVEKQHLAKIWMWLLVNKQKQLVVNLLLLVLSQKHLVKLLLQ